jgi:hypothetical protein
MRSLWGKPGVIKDGIKLSLEEDSLVKLVLITLKYGVTA